MCVAAAHLGVGHIHNVLVSLDTLHHVEAVPVQHFGLSVPGRHQDHVAGDAVLQGLDLVAEGAHGTCSNSSPRRHADKRRALRLHATTQW